MKMMYYHGKEWVEAHSLLHPQFVGHLLAPMFE
jgi:hypothetical protein